MAGSVLGATKAKFVATLEAGSHLLAEEFLRRYEEIPEVKKAELINGIVYMGSPVSAGGHADRDALVQMVLGVYAAHTPGVKHSTNATVCLGTKNIAQPDASLRLTPEHGGAARLDEKGYIMGPPELAVEIAASSASMDAREKKTAYRTSKIPEYLLWRTEDEVVNWWQLEGNEYCALKPHAGGSLRSKVFPGLWIDVEALFLGDSAKLLAKLQEGIRSPEHREFVTELAK